MRLFCALMLSLSASTASAECLTWQQMLGRLSQYGQIPVAHGLIRSATLTPFVNPDGVWTIVRRTPLGCTSVFAQGIGWRWLSRKRPSE